MSDSPLTMVTRIVKNNSENMLCLLTGSFVSISVVIPIVLPVEPNGAAHRLKFVIIMGLVRVLNDRNYRFQLNVFAGFVR